MSPTSSSTDLSQSTGATTRGYESDVTRLRWFVVAVAAMATSLIVVAISLRAFLQLCSSSPRNVDVAASVLARQSSPPDPAAPPLQPSVSHDRTPAEDIAKLRHDEDRVFAALGWSQDGTSRPPRIPDSIVSRLTVEIGTRNGQGRQLGTTEPMPNGANAR